VFRDSTTLVNSAKALEVYTILAKWISSYYLCYVCAGSSTATRQKLSLQKDLVLPALDILRSWVHGA